MHASVVRLGVSCAASLLLASCLYMREGSAPRRIRSAARHEQHVPGVEGMAHRATPLAGPEVPPHPFMAPHGASCMHVDPYTSNTYAGPGPLGITPQVDSRKMGLLGGECPTMNFDRRGRILAVCVRDRRPSLVLLDPESLAVLDRHTLPRRRTPLLRVRKIMQDTSGGAYFYLDQEDRAVIGTTAGTIQIVETLETPDGPRLRLARSIDVSGVLTDANGELDRITAVMPDYAGNYWFAARRGTVGVVSGKRVRQLRFPREEIQNAFSVSADGVYVVTDHALYRLELRADQKPQIVWREAYDRGGKRKLGQINQGSGTTPTLFGNDYVAIADNAEPRMNVLVYRRAAEVDAPRLVCKLGVFEPHRSATENTMIGHGRSLIVENNYGYDIFRTMRRGKTSVGGVARIDVRADESGCDLMWESKEISQTAVPKLSTATGLVYLYTKLKDPPQGIDAYYFTAIDFETGRTVYRVLTGTGIRYDNNWASISLAPDGTAFVGVLNGLIRVRDQKRLHADDSDQKPSL